MDPAALRAAGSRPFWGVLAALLVLVCLAASGCGSSDSSQKDSSAASSTPAAYVSGGSASLEQQLGTTFRAQLYNLAVETQPGDDTADLGQHLPTGKLSRVGCKSPSARPASGNWKWNCVVRWRTVDGAPVKTPYAVAVTPKGCVYANASPRLKQVIDTTTQAPAENPLGLLVVPRAGC